MMFIEGHVPMQLTLLIAQLFSILLRHTLFIDKLQAHAVLATCNLCISL